MKAVAMRSLEGRSIKFVSDHFFGMDGQYKDGMTYEIGVDISEDNALFAVEKGKAYVRPQLRIVETPEEERPGNEEVDSEKVEVDSPVTREELKKRRADAFFRHLQAYARNEMMRYVAVGLLIVIAASHLADKYLDRQEAAHAARMVSMAKLEGRPLLVAPTREELTLQKGMRDFDLKELLPKAHQLVADGYQVAEGK